MFPVKVKGTCPLKVHQLKWGGWARAHKAPRSAYVKASQISKANFAYARIPKSN